MRISLQKNLMKEKKNDILNNYFLLLHKIIFPYNPHNELKSSKILLSTHSRLKDFSKLTDFLIFIIITAVFRNETNNSIALKRKKITIITQTKNR